jgi:outer membrane protein OmpA-like peptidoglycan-associated protein
VVLKSRSDGRLAGRCASLIFLWSAIAGCAARQRPKELVALEHLRSDPSLSESDRHAFDLLAAADDLMVRAEGEWERRNAQGARRDALVGQIRMKTALAILQVEHTQSRIAELDAELAVAQDEQTRLDDQLATVSEETTLLERLRETKIAHAEERRVLSEQVDTAKKQVVSEHQRMADQLAAEKRRAEALDGIRRAELAIQTAETVDAPRYAKAKYTAATNMLQQAHKDFDAGHWDDALARTALALTEAEGGLTMARPQYDKAVETMSIRARDRMLEEDATGLSGISTRLDRESDLQRLVLVLTGRFGAKQSVLSPEAAKILDGVKDLLAKYPTYPVQITGFTDDQGAPADLAALSLARANAVYWALVTRGLDPKRMNVDGKGESDPVADNSTAVGRAKNSRIEVSILYHISE